MNREQAARHNFGVAEATADAGWACVISFYAALHAVEFERENRGIACGDDRHHQIRQWVKKNLGAASRAYEALWTLGHDARYQPSELPMGDQDKALALKHARHVLSFCKVP